MTDRLPFPGSRGPELGTLLVPFWSRCTFFFSIHPGASRSSSSTGELPVTQAQRDALPPPPPPVHSTFHLRKWAVSGYSVMVVCCVKHMRYCLANATSGIGETAELIKLMF